MKSLQTTNRCEYMVHPVVLFRLGGTQMTAVMNSEEFKHYFEVQSKDGDEVTITSQGVPWLFRKEDSVWVQAFKWTWA